MDVRRELQELEQASDEELETCLTQNFVSAFGTWSTILRAIAWARRGAYASARADVDEALAKTPVFELIELTGAMLLFVTRDYGRCVELLEGVAGRHPYLAQQTLRVAIGRAQRLGWAEEQRRFTQALGALGVRDLAAHLDRVRRERARRERHEGEPGERAQGIYASLGELGVAEVARLLDELLAEDAGCVSATILRARVHLMLDEIDRAARLLAGLEPAEPEARAERLALALARGEATSDPGLMKTDEVSARLLALQGEAARASGQLDLACERLELARLRAPESASIALLAWLATLERDDAHPTPEQFAALYARAPGLLSDAARELGVGLWIDGGLSPKREQLAQVLAHAATLLTRERDLERPRYRTRTGDGSLRLRHFPSPARAAAIHEHDARDLDQIAAITLRVLERTRISARASHEGPAAPGSLQTAPAGPARPKDDRELGDEQIDSFVADGYVHLRQAFPREAAEEIVADAQRRMRDEPERWFQDRTLAGTRVDLSGYDPEDRKTWPRGRVDLLGDRRYAISEFSPFAARAIVQLLYGCRVATRTWSNNLIIQFPNRDSGPWRPGPEWESWHLDSPSTETRLDDLRTGLLVFVLFSDLLPDSGNTWMALDSPAKVAAALAAHPEGMDFCHIDTAPAITRTCERFMEVTGEAGDILLVHPLMLHSASRNPSRRVRWMGNPMIYVDRPLDHERVGASPVERAIALALAR